MVPRHRSPLRVEVSARFDLPVEEALFYQPGRTTARLTVPLPEPEPVPPSTPPIESAPATKPRDPRIFISYASEEADGPLPAIADRIRRHDRTGGIGSPIRIV
ncbi:hypothetical protein [Nocardia bovistercoris]|uniref:Uncharacterized protein n=1 Tax=Nocardia bovistercoris TaxID=2785916 RepID=A0A931ICX1_9NOCA|nr:hypothetical protein [Nocardia bovistercoris]MBH0779352.1 hypothetical protein [Nocardia bovistercoris]